MLPPAWGNYYREEKLKILLLVLHTNETTYSLNYFISRGTHRTSTASVLILFFYILVTFNFCLQICSSLAGQAFNNHLAEIKWVKNDKRVENQMYVVEAINAAVISPSCYCGTSRGYVPERPEVAVMNALAAVAVEPHWEEAAWWQGEPRHRQEQTERHMTDLRRDGSCRQPSSLSP